MSGKPVFFSGGTALRSLSALMASRGIPSCHLVSVFDSGGSSAALRKTFSMPAVGDLRNRLLALADPALPQAVLDFCNLRLPPKGTHEELGVWLSYFASLSSPHWAEMPKAHMRPMWLALRRFIRAMPQGFDLTEASLGNLMLAGVYLRGGRDLPGAVAFFSQLLRARGEVLPIALANAHLGARLANGASIVGQHLFKSLPAPVEELFLSVHESGEAAPGDVAPCHPPLYPECAQRIKAASLVCFPMGSFYSSVLANLLARGAGIAVASSGAPKVFIPNSGHDPESQGLDVPAQADLILRILRAETPDAPVSTLLNYVLVDSRNGAYPGGMGAEVVARLERLGLEVVDAPLISPNAPASHMPEQLLAELLKLARP